MVGAMVKLHGSARRRLIVPLLAAAVLTALAPAAWADHGAMPRIHWASPQRAAVKVYNRAGSPYVAEAIAGLNSAAGGKVRFDPDIVTGGDPNDCSRPPNGTVAVCIDTRGNPYALLAGNAHLGWCVVGLAWDGFPVNAHELGHCLGMGHHPSTGPPWQGGIMGGEEKITHVDVEALASIYSHSDDVPAPAPPPAPVTAPGPAPVAPMAVAPPAVQYGYSCGSVTNVGDTTATLGAITTDVGTLRVRFDVFGPSGYPADYPVTALGPPFYAGVKNLSPATTYTFTVTFEPSAHVVSGAGCSFTTQAAQAPTASPAAASPPVAPAAAPPPTPPPVSPAPASPNSGRWCLLLCLG